MVPSRIAWLFVCLLGPGTAFGWLGRGHEQIADIAWHQLGPEARTEVAAILKEGDKEFVPSSDDEKDVRAAFRKASTWADWIKEHKESSFEEWILAWNAKYQPGYSPDDKDREAHRCKRWHYFDVPVNFKGNSPGVEGSNALIAMTTARYEFAIMARQSFKDRKGQCWWLYWMTHVIGDLHQPLHCVSSFEFDARGDAGGNFFKLGVGYPDNPERMANLHFFWDQGIENAIAMEKDKPGDFESVTQRWCKEYAPFHNDASNLDFASWIAQGAKDAVGLVYAGISRDGVPTDEYRVKQAEFSKKQAVLAGFRLAKEISMGLGLDS